jgi:hypothetical protein
VLQTAQTTGAISILTASIQLNAYLRSPGLLAGFFVHCAFESKRARLKPATFAISPIDAMPVKFVDDARFGRRVLRFRLCGDLGLIRHDGGLIPRLLSLWLLSRLRWFD